MKILSKQNFNQNESKNFVVDNLSSAPSNPILGQIYYNTKDERAYVCIKAGDTPEWADLSLQEEVAISEEEPEGRDLKIWINPEDITASNDYGSLPIGSIIPYSGETAPEGYSICDGKELNRETYKELFSIIGTTFGNGDGSSTFNLPDLKGRVSVGLDSSDSDFNVLGKTGGSKYLQAHTHYIVTSANTFGAGSYGNRQAVSGSNNENYTTSSTGEGNSGNLQPYITLNYIIKIYGEAMLTGDVVDSLEGDSSYNAPSIHAVNTKIKELEAYSSTAINEGSYITLDPNPNPNYNPISIQIDGKSEQTTTKGNQLLDFSKYDSRSSDTMTLTFENDVLTTTCIASGTYRSFTWIITDLIKANPGKTLSFTFDKYDKSQATDSSVNLQIYTGTETSYWGLVRADGSSVPYTIPEDVSNISTVNFRVLPNNSATAKAATLVITKPMLQFGAEKLDYEEYTGGQPSPNPDYPQEIKSVEGIENLCPNSRVEDTQTISGITFTRRNDGSVVANGTSTSSLKYYFQPDGEITKVLKAGNYIGSTSMINAPTSGTVTAYIRNGEAGDYKLFGGKSASQVIQLDTDFTYTCSYIFFSSGVTLDNCIMYPSINKGDTLLPYVPYGRWLNVEDTGKNLIEYLEIGGIDTTTGLNTTNNTRKRTNYIEIEPNETYSLSSNITTWRWGCFYDRNKNFISNIQWFTNNKYLFISPDNAYYFREYLGAVGAIPIEDIQEQLEKGKEATSYEPYHKKQSMLIDMDKSNLCNIASWQGYQYSNSLPSSVNSNVVINSSSINSVNFTINANLYLYALSNTIELKPNTTYTLSYSRNNSQSITSSRYYIYSVSGSYSIINNGTDSGTNNTVSFTTQDSGKIAIAFGADNTASGTTCDISDINIYEGDKDYYELCSIGDTKDKLNVDKDGNASKVEIFGETILDGVNNKFQVKHSTITSDTKGFYRFELENKNKSRGYGSLETLLSNYFLPRSGTAQESFNNYSSGIWWEGNTNYCYAILEKTTLADANDWLKSLYDAGTPVTVKYLLDEYQTITLNKTEPLKLLEGTNNISTSDELQPNMEIEYYTDVMGNPGVIPDYDGLPVGSEIDYDGTEIPDGYEQVDNVLWTNSTPTQNFSAQNITLSNGSYDILKIFYIDYRENKGMLSIDVLKGNNGNLIANTLIGDSIYVATRKITYTNDTTLSVGNASCFTNGAVDSVQTDNVAQCIPIKIIGYNL